MPQPVPCRATLHGILALLLAGSLVATPPATAAEPGPLRRVLLLSVDTLSADHLQLYGYHAPTTSVMDSLAGEGVLFRHCLVPQVWTLSSHMSLFTGLAPGVHRVGMDRPLTAAVPTLAGLLQEQGCQTVGFFTSNYWLGAAFGFDRGFREYRSFAWHQAVGEAAASWLDVHAPRPGQPFFAFIHYMDVHTQPATSPYPYQPLEPSWWRTPPASAGVSGQHLRELPPDDPFHGRGVLQWDLAKYDLDFLRDSYDDCLRFWDGVRLPRILDGLRESGHLDDTLIIITADHGEEFLEHGQYLHHSPHREVREVPLVMIWPGRLPKGGVVDQRVSLMDLAPTILDLAELAPLPAAQGISLRPVLEEPRAALPRRDFLVDGDHRGYRQEDTGLVAHADGRWWLLKARCDTTGTAGTFRPARVATVEGLYDLDGDPGEQHDLRATHPDRVAELRRRLDERLAEEARLAAVLLTDAPEAAVELTDEQRRRLKSLGY